MRRVWFVVSFIMMISILFVGCSGNNDENNNNNDNNNENNTVNEENNNNENNENEAANQNNNEEDLNENENNENETEETFADEVKVLDVETVLHDQDEVSEFDPNEHSIIEHEELMYIEHDFITEVLDYEFTYDEEETFAEVFEGKGDFTYEPSHEDGSMMDLGQIYIEELDKYENISGDVEELFKMIEYEDKLYVPERLINVFMKSPLNYERRDQVLEIGLQAEAEDLYDVGVADDSSNKIEATQNASDVTVEGENHDGGIIIKNINSASKNADIATNFNYSEINGFIHNFSDEETIEIKFQYADEKTLDSVDLKPGETHEFEYDVKGEPVFKVVAEGTPGSSSEAVIIGELN